MDTWATSWRHQAVTRRPELHTTKECSSRESGGLDPPSQTVLPLFVWRLGSPAGEGNRLIREHHRKRRFDRDPRGVRTNMGEATHSLTGLRRLYSAARRRAIRTLVRED